MKKKCQECNPSRGLECSPASSKSQKMSLSDGVSIALRHVTASRGSVENILSDGGALIDLN